MPPATAIAVPIASERAISPRWSDRQMVVGSAASSVMHVAAAVAIWYALWADAPPPPPSFFPVDLVVLGTNTTSPSTAPIAAAPAQRVGDGIAAAPADAIPPADGALLTPPAIPEHKEDVPLSSPPRVAAPDTPELARAPARDIAAAASAQPASPAAPGRMAEAPPPMPPQATDAQQPEPAHEAALAEIPPLPRVKPHPPRVAAPKAEPAPVPPTDALSARLKLLGALRQPSDPSPQGRSGASAATASSADAARAPNAAYRVRDFIRAQVERRWNPDSREAGGHDWVASIHVELGRDGTVRRAEIVDDPRFAGDDAYLGFARSARNAVILSSPLTIPPGAYDIAKNMVLPFSARRVLQ